jgi:hypothetical protein
MKNKLIIAIILLVLTFKIQAQTVDSTVIPMKGRTYARIFDSLSTGLIKSRIVSGVLLNRVNITSGVDYWINNDTLSNTSVKQAFYELEQAVFDPLLRTTTKFTTMRSTVEKDKRLAKLPIIAIRHNFEIIDTNAVANGTLQIISGRKIDKNLVAKPYISRQVNIAAIDFDHIYAGTTYFFTFATANTLNNTAQAISSVIITNVSNNTVKTITPNATNQSILFSTAGTYTLKIQVIVGGITYTNFQKVQVSPAYNNSASISSFGPTSICNPMHGVIASTIPFQGMGETFASTSWADYHVYLRSNATCPATTPSNILANISKPIIILDGFDPLDKARNYHILYNDKLLSESNGDKTLLGERLRTLGYDVIILNFPVLGSKAANKGTGIDIPSVVKKAVGTLLVDVNLDGRDGGADFIERNAMILIALIQKVNAALAANSSTNKLVIVGPSMGGQISRYALAYMEKQIQTTPTNTAMNHNTRLWISFDSPHWGANIPLSLQQAVYFLGYTGNQQDAKDSYTQQLYSPAARQMLIEQLNGQNNLEPLRTNYINNVTANGKTNSLGWPQNLRKIALVNGTKTGTRLYNDGDPFLDIVGKKLIGGNFIGLKLKVAEIKTNFLKDNNVNHRIFKGRFSEKNGLSFTIYDQETSINGYNPIRGSVDVSPSGTFNAQQDLHDLFIAGLQKENIRLIYDNNFKPLHSFIPTVSSLGFKNPNFNWSTPLNNRNLLCGGTGGANEIYFDNYFAPTENQDHVFLSAEAAKWGRTRNNGRCQSLPSNM